MNPSSLSIRLKAELEERLGVELPYAAAIPPGVSEGSVKSIGYVLEGAGFEVTNIVDEPTAAAAVLKITDGAVVDVGGGTFGISIQRWPGHLHRRRSHRRQPYDYDRCRTLPHPIRRSRSPQDHSGKRRRNLPCHQSRNRKMATITEKFLHGYQVPAVYVVGGSASFHELPLYSKRSSAFRSTARFIRFS